MRRLYLYVSVLLLVALNIHINAQALFYYNGFEVASDSVGWTFVDDQISDNRWQIGTAVNCGGTSVGSLYVSSDGGRTASYNSNVAGMALAYMDFVLPQGETYSIYFDWMAMGEFGVDEVSVCFFDSLPQSMAIGSNGVYPLWYTQNVRLRLSNSTTWQKAAITVVGTGNVQRLTFVWRNNGNGIGSSPGGCVDNLYISRCSDMGYFHDFSDSTENNYWIINNGPSFMNRWCIGSADYASAHSSLYVSADSGVTSGYGNSASLVTAYREFLLADNVVLDVSFDWKCYGEMKQNYIHAYWVTDTTILLYSTHTVSALNALQPYAVDVNKGTQMRGAIGWRSGSFVVNGDGRPARLLFLWRNNDVNNYLPGGVIDNIEITDRNCARPTGLNVTVSGKQATLHWNSNGSSNYEVIYRNHFMNKDAPFIVLQNQSSPCVINGLEQGRYSFWVRQVCDDTLANG